MVGGGRWEVGSGRWEVGGGKWEVGGGRWEVGGGRWEMGLKKKTITRRCSLGMVDKAPTQSFTFDNARVRVVARKTIHFHN